MLCKAVSISRLKTAQLRLKQNSNFSIACTKTHLFLIDNVLAMVSHREIDHQVQGNIFNIAQQISRIFKSR